MLSIVGIAPHGTLVIKELKHKDYSKSIQTNIGFQQLRYMFDKKNVDHIVIIDPHAPIVKNKISVVMSNTMQGKLSKLLNIKNDLQISSSIFQIIDHENKNQITENIFNLQWGSLVPLHFIHNQQTCSLITIDRNIRKDNILDFGKKLGLLLDSINKKIGIILSCDFAHTHSKTNINFPFSEKAKMFDDRVVELIKKQNIEQFVNIDNEIIKHAGTDATAQMLVLCGILKNRKMHQQFLTYEVPTYFGMITSYFL